MTHVASATYLADGPPAAGTGSLDPLFVPRGVVLVGASTSPGKLGAAMARNLAHFRGPVALVNTRNPQPGAGLYGSVGEAAAEMDAAFDLAVLCVPAAVSTAMLAAVAEAGVRAAVVCAGGFAEAPGPGPAHQEALSAVAAGTGIRILGPNTSGFVVPGRRLIASFVPSAADVPPGNVAIVSSSGGVNHALAFMLANVGVGVSLAVGIGNGVDVAAADVLDYVAGDPQTKAVALHVETLADGRALVAAVRQLTLTKPVVALVVGRSDVSEFGRSHTGRLAPSWQVARSVLAQAGAVVVDDERDLAVAVTALSCARLPASPRPGVAVITAQAGPGLLLTDRLRSDGVAVPALTDATRQQLSDLLPPLTYQRNPVDTGRPAPGFHNVLATVGADPAIDLLAVYALFEPDAVDLGRVAPRLPTVMAIGGMEHDVREVRARLRGAGVPCLTDPTSLAVAVRALHDDAWGRHRSTARDIPHAHSAPTLSAGAWQGPCDEHHAKKLIQACGIPAPRRRVCESHTDAHQALKDFGSPVAVKLLSATVAHKTDVGGVRLGVATPAQLQDALEALDSAGAQRYLVEQMAPDGVDLLLGARRDPHFGPVAVLGLGGTMTEVLSDVAVRLAPLSRGEALAMPDDLAGKAVLGGWRGYPPIDREQLADMILAIGDLIAARPEFAEVEINPLRSVPGGFLALDAVVTVTEKGGA